MVLVVGCHEAGDNRGLLRRRVVRKTDPTTNATRITMTLAVASILVFISISMSTAYCELVFSGNILFASAVMTAGTTVPSGSVSDS